MSTFQGFRHLYFTTQVRRQNLLNVCGHSSQIVTKICQKCIVFFTLAYMTHQFPPPTIFVVLCVCITQTLARGVHSVHTRALSFVKDCFMVENRI